MKKFITFSASWCEPGNLINDTLQKLADQKQITLEKYDMDHHPEIFSNMNVKSVPVVYIYPNGRKLVKDKIYKIYGYIRPTDYYQEMDEITGQVIERKAFKKILEDLIKEA